MRCPRPKCGGKTYVIDTREVTSISGVYTRRRRKCYSCQVRFTSFESIHHQKALNQRFDRLRSSAVNVVGVLMKTFNIKADEL